MRFGERPCCSQEAFCSRWLRWGAILLQSALPNGYITCHSRATTRESVALVE